MSPAPSDAHQKVLDKIYRQLGNFIEENNLGVTRVAPYDVFLDKKNIFQPDIIFIAKENLHLIKEDGLHGVPDLVIEILSPATMQYDIKEKKEAYEKHGVKEYWIIDPLKKTAEGYSLHNGRFQSLPAMQEKISFNLFDLSFSF
jgi:Uma2 family endonuclease